MDRPTGPARWWLGSRIAVSAWCDSRMPACQRRATEVWSCLSGHPLPGPPPLRGRGKLAAAPALPLPRSGGGLGRGCRVSFPRRRRLARSRRALTPAHRPRIIARRRCRRRRLYVRGYTPHPAPTVRRPSAAPADPQPVRQWRARIDPGRGPPACRWLPDRHRVWRGLGVLDPHSPPGPIRRGTRAARSCSCASMRAAPITASPPIPTHSPHAWPQSSRTPPCTQSSAQRTSQQFNNTPRRKTPGSSAAN